MTPARASEIQFRIAAAEPDFDQVRLLLREYNEFLCTILDPALLRHRETELEALPGAFAPPRGALVLATLAGRAVGCIGLRPLALPSGEEAAECCRMWVTPPARGRALGGMLVMQVIGLARERGYRALYLNSVPKTMGAAYQLYLQLGFEPVAPYKHVAIPGIRFLGLHLTKQEQAC